MESNNYDLKEVSTRSPSNRNDIKNMASSVEKRNDAKNKPLLEITTTTRSDGEHDAPVLEELDNEENSVAARDRPQKQRMSSSRRYFCYAIALWIIEFVLVVCLKRVGLLERSPFQDLNDAMLESVSTVLPHINESLGSLTHGMTTERKNVGYKLAEQGAEANYPIVMVPGFVTSGLEVWSGKECTKGFFRQRLWAAFTGARSFLVERECWREHMKLDPWTGGDPEDIRVRASEGFAATDYFLGSYWVWGKLIENLAEVGYTSSNMVMQPFDWRLPFTLLEERDGYLTNLKYRIEAMHKTTGKKIVLVTHSMGAQVVSHFFGWVTASEKQGGGGGGKKWVDKHLHTYINIAGSHLGVPKAATALLSGEMSDTVFAGRMASMVESFFGRRLRRDLWSSWGSLWAMLPKGGDALWGPGADLCKVRSANDTFCLESEESLTPLIAMTDTADAKNAPLEEGTANRSDLNATLEKFVSEQLHMTDDLLDFLVLYGSGLGPGTVGSKFHSQHGEDKVKSKVWYDVTRSPLPYAPSMRIFCLYGTGLPTERAYYYKRNWEEPKEETSPRILSDPAVCIDPITDDDKGVKYGVRYVDGDGSVPLLSLGYICADAWTREDSGLNPSQSKVYTREYVHKSEFCVDDPMRGGPSSSDHVDILGNTAMMEDFIRIVTEFEPEEVTKDHIESDIREIAAKINAHPFGGIFKKKRWLQR